MRIGLGQFNSVVGDLPGNVRKIQEFYTRALKEKMDLLVCPELCICGYPPEDLVLKKHFLEQCTSSIEQTAAACPDMTIIAGFVETDGEESYNSAAVMYGGKVTKIYRKGQLPNHGVFDERRYFQPGNKPLIIDVGGITIAVTICADIWHLKWLADFLKNSMPFDMLVNISASPFGYGKIDVREHVIRDCSLKLNCAVAYCNLIGGQDEIVFDGRSILTESTGKTITKAKAFDEDLLIADIVRTENGKVQIKPLIPAVPQPKNTIDEIYQALVLGTRDYTLKNGFQKVLLGLSGGIDSSLVAAIAVTALGRENVIGITMPTQFNSPETISDAGKLAKNLGIEFLTIPIQSVLQAFDNSLKTVHGWESKGIAYENLQARIRGTILMSLSNKTGSLVLTTGNKSETAVGYSTLYGDTAGGFAVIKDVPKTMVYELARHINTIAGWDIIPSDVLTRIPSAELKYNQKDSDSLPDYDLLDEILKGYVEDDKSAGQLIQSGLPKDIVLRVIRMVDKNEYKRRQSPPGVKITSKAFGKDRRLPITNYYKSGSDMTGS
ncbi:MAG: NAD+ synthase [Sedimentisphaerales bacterium]|nr:NAD+ synthase [Sedimentisphaerales bacterium]